VTVSPGLLTAPQWPEEHKERESGEENDDRRRRMADM
jgi:hypothetical protein